MQVLMHSRAIHLLIAVPDGNPGAAGLAAASANEPLASMDQSGGLIGYAREG